MEFVPFIVLAAMNKKIIDWLRSLISDKHEAKVMIPISWAVGAALAFVFSTSEMLAGKIEIWSGLTLADADSTAVGIYGIALASAGGIIHDAVKPNTPPHDDEGGRSYAEAKPLPPG